jgi:cell wall-associated NlpC family hydrolase
VVSRVQGIDSSLTDLTLHDGRKVAIEIGGAILPGPTIIRTIAGSSSISLALQDSSMAFLDAALLSEKFDALLDGLWFRYMGAVLAPPQVTLTLEDRNVAELREIGGRVKAYRRGPKAKADAKHMTRAEFIVARIKEVHPRAEITCPQLHVVQPIKTERQGKQAAANAKTERGKGIGDVKGLTVAGVKATSAQIDKANRALRVAESLSVPQQVELALLVALMDESHIGELTPNILEQESFTAPNTDHTNVEESVKGFLTGYNSGEPGAIGVFKANPGFSPAEIATTVQRNRDGAAPYERFSSEAAKWLEAFGGGTLGSGSTTTVTEPYKFEIKKGEDYWTGIKRLAKEVNWRAFWVGDRFFYIAETDLFRSQVRLAIKREKGEAKPSTDGIEKVSFSFNANRKVTEVTVEADAKKWTPPPGSVVTLEGYGPASIGSGDAPVKANKKGQKQGVSSAVVAATHEGRGRYLVESIEAPLRDSDVSDLKRITVKLRKPTAPLPEPAPATKTTSPSTTGSAASNPTVQRMLETAEKIANKNPPYVWGGFSESGYDCSGFVSKILDVGGFLQGRLDTKGLAGWGEAGPGESVTVYVHTGTGSATTEHTIIEIAGKFFQSGGGQNSSASGGAEEFTPSPSYLAEFNVKRHPKGL